MKGKSSPAKRVALGALLAAVAVALLAISNLVAVMDLALAALAALAVFVAQIEGGTRLSLPVYIVSAALSLLLFPVKSAALFYACFFGWYPLVKSRVDKLSPLFAWLIKAVCAAAAGALVYVCVTYVFVLPEVLKGFTLPILLLMAAVFVLYDIGLSRLILFYIQTLRRRVKGK